MRDRIEASWQTLMDQASMTASDYLARGIREIDSRLGDGYAEKHPELMGAFINACAVDLLASTIGKVIQDGMTEIAEAIQQHE